MPLSNEFNITRWFINESEQGDTINAPPPEIEIIRVLVLDCRSGQPIKNAPVKKVKMGEITDKFERNSKKIKIISGVTGQKALNALGYNCGKKPTEKYGNKGSAAYNKYWEDRGISVKNIESGTTPPKNRLKEIIAEYNGLRATDDNGILSIPVPVKKFLSMGFDLEIGFHDFAVVAEALKKNKKDEKGVISRKTKALSETGFSIEWGNEKQGIKWGENFGWKIGSQPSSSENPQGNFAEFKVSEKLKIGKNGGMFTTFQALQKADGCFSKFYPDDDNSQGDDNLKPQGGDNLKPQGGDNLKPQGGDNLKPQGG